MFSEIDVGFGSTNTRIIGNYCGDVHTSADYPTSAKYGIWLHDGAKHTVIVGNSCPPAELVSGGFFAEPGSTYSAVSNTGVPDSYTTAAPVPAKGQEFQTTGASIGTTAGSTNSTVWVGLKGKRGGTLLLPAPSAVTAGQTFVFKDEGGAASLANIILDANGSKVDGKPTVSIVKDYGSVRLRFDGAEWWSW